MASHSKRRQIFRGETLETRIALDGHGIFFGPTTYASQADTPDGFTSECGQCESFLEDLEDNDIDFGLQITPGMIAAPGDGLQAQIDSVDSDDGALDGTGQSGLGGHSFFSSANQITVEFPSNVKSAGLVWTDGDTSLTGVVFEAFDTNGDSIGSVEAGDLADDRNDGTTAEDRFFGVRIADGESSEIGSLVITNIGGNGIEIDHIQFETNPTMSGDGTIDLELTKTVDREKVVDGEQVVWTIVVTNLGQEGATDVVVGDLLPAGLQLVSAQPSQGDFDAATGTWTIGDIDSSGVATLSLTTDVVVGDGMITDSTLTGPLVETGPDTYRDASGISFTFDDPRFITSGAVYADAPIGLPGLNSGGSLTIDIPSDITAKTLSIYDLDAIEVDSATFDELLISVDGTSLGSFTQNFNIDNNDSFNIGVVGVPIEGASQVTIESIGTFGLTYFDLTFDQEIPDMITNVAQVIAAGQIDIDSQPNNDDGDQSQDDEDAATVMVTDAVIDLELDKTVNQDNVVIGDRVTWTIDVTNQPSEAGITEATGVAVGDLIPTGLQLVSANPERGTFNEASGTWTIGNVDVGEVVSLELVTDVVGGGSTSANLSLPLSGAGGNVYQDASGVSLEFESQPLFTPAGVYTNAPIGLPLLNVGSSVDITIPGNVNVTELKIYDLDALDVDSPTIDEVAITVDGNSLGSFTQNFNIANDLAYTTGVLSIPINGASTITIDSIGTYGLLFFDLGFEQDASNMITNVAQVIAANEPDVDSQPDNDDGDQSQDDEDWAKVTIIDPVIDLELDKELISTSSNGLEHEWRLTVTNNANANSAADGISIFDNIPDGMTVTGANTGNGSVVNVTSNDYLWTLANSLAPGESATLNVSTTIVDASFVNYTNTAEVVGANFTDADSTPDNGIISEDDYDAVTVMASLVDLQLSKMVDRPEALIGEQVTWTIEVTNASNPTIGLSDATGVVVGDLLPAGLQFVTANAERGAFNPTTGTWDVGSVAVGEVVTLEIVTEVVSGGLSNSTLTLPLTETGVNTYQDASGTSLTFSSSPFFTPGGVYTDAPAGLPGLNPGGSLTIAIPSSVTATELRIYDLDSLDVGSSVFDEVTVAVDGTSLGSFTQNFNIANDVAFTTDVLTIPIDGASTITIASIGNYGTLFFDLGIGQETSNIICNVAQVINADQPDIDSQPNNDDGDQSQDDEDSAKLTVIDPVVDLELDKELLSTSANGLDHEWRITITNNDANANSSASDISVFDNVPDGMVVTGASTNNGSVVNVSSNDYLWNLATSLAPGESATLDISTTINDVSFTSYTNTAEIAGATGVDIDSSPGNGIISEDDDAAVTVMASLIDLQLNKTVDQASVLRGERVTWTIEVTNQPNQTIGLSDATGVVVGDLLPAGLQLVSATPSQGTFDSATGTWTIGDVDLGDVVTLELVTDVIGGGSNGVGSSMLSLPLTQTGPNTFEEGAGVSLSFSSTPLMTPAGVFTNAPTGLPTLNRGDSVTIGIPSGADVTELIIYDLDSLNVDSSTFDEVTITVDGTSLGSFSQNFNIANDLAFTTDAVSVPLNGASSITIDSTGNYGLLFFDLRFGHNASNVICNVAQVTAADQPDLDSQVNNDDGDQSQDDEDSAKLTVLDQIDLELSKTVDDATPTVGTDVTWTIVVTNNADNATTAATGVTIGDTLPAGLDVVGATTNNGSFNASNAIWTLATPLAPGASAELEIVTTVNTFEYPDYYHRGHHHGHNHHTPDDPFMVVNVAEVLSADQVDTDSQVNNDDGDQSQDDEANAKITPQAEAMVSGYVYFDVNNDGVFQSYETPITGVEVKLVGTDILGNQVTRRTFTNRDGFYKFNDLVAGNYMILETQSGLLIDGMESVGSLGGSSPANDKFNVTLDTDDSGENYNFGERGLKYPSKRLYLASSHDFRWFHLDVRNNDIWYWFHASGSHVRGHFDYHHPHGSAHVELYDQYMNPVSHADSHYDWHVNNGDMYYVRLSGDHSNFNFNLDQTGGHPTHQGDELIIWGTDNDNVIEVHSHDTHHEVIVDGVSREYSADGIRTIRVNAGGGQDRVTLYGTQHDETARFRETHVSLEGGDADTTVYGAEYVRVFGGGGNDRARYFDTAGNDNVYMHNDYSVFAGHGYEYRVEDFDRVEAVASSGNDRAYYYDSLGDDIFKSYTTHAYMNTDIVTNYASGFDRYNAYSNNGGNDHAYFHGTDRNETYGARPTFAYLTGYGHTQYASGFNLVDAYSGGGYDRAKFYDTVGDDYFVGEVGYAFLEGGSYSNAAHDFTNVQAHSSGGNDRADLYTSADGNDIFYGRATNSYLKSGEYTTTVNDFHRVDAHSEGGFDRAHFEDTAGYDVFHGGHGMSWMESGDYEMAAHGFDRIDAYSKRGGNDLAMFTDSAADDLFVSHSDFGYMNGGGVVNYTNGFTKLEAVAENGGNDRAVYRAARVGHVLSGEADWARLTGNGRDDLVRGFDFVEGRADAGQSPNKDIDAIDYVFNTIGDWSEE